jgi:peptidoglycan hydrolase-like protein with peptidoglycan-binding domain
MRKLFLILIATLSLSLAVFAQTNNTPTQNTSAQTATKKRPPVFRANKEQVTEAQKMLKVTGSGKLDNETRSALKAYQGANGLKATGTLNRATLEKMNIVLTDKQKEIPVSASSFASSDTTKSSASKPRGAVFRATKEQIMQAQKMMKEKAMYSGAETGKLDGATREGLKKFQGSGSMKVTGTLNKETLEKMGIALTDKQKQMD